MASIKEAFEDTILEQYSFVKLFVFAIPVFFAYTSYKAGNTAMFHIMSAVSIFLLTIMMIIVINNTSNANNTVLPSFEPIEFLKTTFLSVITLGPIIVLLSFAAYTLGEIEIPLPAPNVQNIYKSIIWALFGSVMLDSLIQFSKNFKFSAAYNLKVISNSCVDIFVGLLFLIPQLLILNFLTVGIMYYIFNLFFGVENVIFYMICSVALVANVAITSTYLAQLDYETVERKAENDDLEHFS